MSARSSGAAWIIAASLAGFGWAAWEVIVSPLASGTVYPSFSSLRTDPTGAKALYDSLARLPGVTTARTFKDPSPSGPETTVLFLGLQPDGIEDWKPEAFDHYEHLLSQGGRLILGFVPVDVPAPRPAATRHPPTKQPAPEPKPGIKERWQLEPHFAKQTDKDDPASTALYFESGPEWEVLLENDNGALIVERPLGGGTLVIAAESYSVTNQSLAESPDPELLLDILGSARNFVFDEAHLGVVESGSVATLGRKYHLEPALAALLIAAALFLWRSSTSFLPPRQTNAQAALDGRDSRAGLAALLRRSLPESQLIDACLAEWRRTARASAVHKLTTSWQPTKDAVESYRAACRTLKERS